MKQFIIKLIGISAIAMVFGATTLFMHFEQAPEEVVKIAQTELFEVQRGDNLTKLMGRLVSDGKVVRAWPILWREKFNPTYQNIKAGWYELQPDMTLHQLLTLINEGKQKSFSITFPEGSNLREWRAIMGSAEHLKVTIDSSEALQKLLKVAQHPEGLLFADTYQYHVGDSDKSIYLRAHKRLNQELELAWQSIAEPSVLKSAYELLTLASIIEKETALEKERTLVAAVFYNRLKKKMRLQTDPTVIYGLGEAFDGNITRKHLREYTPYNTYRINGLPPTPIANVGRSSLLAAAKPAQVDYLYFVATGQNGEHIFSTNLKAHNRAVNKYQRKRK